ncbi:MAG: MBL fold metallo-hydrolase [Candidatus Aenigmarchaeota archaeon]|nr:MBL fold metallo-hydrolase [Candidatus Aenigmarchaeota archaeon]
MQKYITLIKGKGYDSNIYILDNEIIVDTGTGENFNEIKKMIENSCDISKIKSIINTHCHFDHVGGNLYFINWLKTGVMMHEKDAYAVENSTDATVANIFERKLRPIKVSRFLKDNERVKTEHLSLKILHTPGHTEGSICIYEENSKVLITGDTLFENTCGRYDFPTGDKDKLIKTLYRILKLNPICILPGHGNKKSKDIDILIRSILERIENQ